jgi:hypothetical protein
MEEGFGLESGQPSTLHISVDIILVFLMTWLAVEAEPIQFLSKTSFFGLLNSGGSTYSTLMFPGHAGTRAARALVRTRRPDKTRQPANQTLEHSKPPTTTIFIFGHEFKSSRRHQRRPVLHSTPSHLHNGKACLC